MKYSGPVFRAWSSGSPRGEVSPRVVGTICTESRVVRFSRGDRPHALENPSAYRAGCEAATPFYRSQSAGLVQLLLQPFSLYFIGVLLCANTLVEKYDNYASVEFK